jgi:hypothetical protein
MGMGWEKVRKKDIVPRSELMLAVVLVSRETVGMVIMLE